MARPYPSGYSGDTGRFDWRRPSSSRSWLPQSAKEWTVSASIAPEPVTKAATPLATAMDRLAPSAKKIARVESPFPAIVGSAPGGRAESSKAPRPPARSPMWEYRGHATQPAPPLARGTRAAQPHAAPDRSDPA